ncbi:hypothetical protein [Micromonospora sp. HNM0581]|uniref:hypothetical protein n=1 Tax=Micromonospora sp. HNM0581 TaxID=2716341 RepID=UPI001F105802|nr:hypothetical protein [Micromonospora sp. HNM0581]
MPAAAGCRVNASLRARFSTGVPWRIDVITYDTPVLSNATGSTVSFANPTRCSGARVTYRVTKSGSSVTG